MVALFFTGALNFLGLNDRKVVDPGANLRLRRIMAAVGLVAVLALAWWLHGDDSATVGSGRSISGTGWLLLLILLGGLVAIGRAIWKRIDRSRADGLNPWPKMALWIGGIVAGLWRLGVMSDNDEAAIFTLVAGIIASASVVMWCISAVSFSFGFLVAACRIRSAACDTRARPCVRCVLWLRGFPLVPALPSVGSAGTEVPLFAAFNGTMAGSDCFNPCIIDSDYLPGQVEALSGPLRGRTCVPGFLDAAEPSRPHESGRSVLPSAADKASALRMTVFRRSISLPARTATDTSHGTSPLIKPRHSE